MSPRPLRGVVRALPLLRVLFTDSCRSNKLLALAMPPATPLPAFATLRTVEPAVERNECGVAGVAGEADVSRVSRAGLATLLACVAAPGPTVSPTAFRCAFRRGLRVSTSPTRMVWRDEDDNVDAWRWKGGGRLEGRTRRSVSPRLRGRRLAFTCEWSTAFN